MEKGEMSMKMKQYIAPSVEVIEVKTIELMAFTGESTSPKNPAPPRRSDVF